MIEKILIYGSKGWIGSQFIDILNENNINYIEGKSRVDDIDNLYQEMLNDKYKLDEINKIYNPMTPREDYKKEYIWKQGIFDIEDYEVTIHVDNVNNKFYYRKK